MLENKRERLKTFLKKIDEKAICRIKHFMRESYAVDGGSFSDKDKKVKTKKKLELTKTHSLDEAKLDLCNKTFARQPPSRSQTFDCDRSMQRSESITGRNSFIKYNKTFHKIFQDLPEHEDLIHSFSCALQKEVPYHGRIYVSENYVCFYSSVLLKDTKVVIPVSSIQVVKKQNTALLLPNALYIRTTGGEKFLFLSLRNREVCFKLLQSVCPQTGEWSTSSSPLFSPQDRRFFAAEKLVTSSQSSLDCSFDQQDSTSMLESSSPRLDREPRITAPLHRKLIKDDSPPEDVTDHQDAPLPPGRCWVWTLADQVKSVFVQRDSSHLNTLLFIYLILVLLLVLTSGYIGLRIVALEEQLSSLGALQEFSLPGSRYKDT